MSKYKNYIFLTICETSIECFEKTRFSTYFNYVNNMAICLETNTLNQSQKCDIATIIDDLEKIYGLNNEMLKQFIIEYFNSDKVLAFEKYVRSQRLIYPKIK